MRFQWIWEFLFALIFLLYYWISVLCAMLHAYTFSCLIAEPNFNEGHASNARRDKQECR